MIKIEDEQKTIQTYTIRVPQLYILEDLYTEQLITTLKVDNVLRSALEPDVSSPPVRLFKTHCSFVFYGSEIPA